jgi:hypothetical protein
MRGNFSLGSAMFAGEFFEGAPQDQIYNSIRGATDGHVLKLCPGAPPSRSLTAG